ncbi:hypothetical protein LTR95_017043 [Oleoguttula sp. CCFEE 5521]
MADGQDGLGSAGGNEAMPSPYKRESMPKRQLIESACSACRKRKSEVEASESRWSALRRKKHDLERDRENYRTLMSLIQSRPEAEAQEIYRDIRANIHGGDIAALIHAIRDGRIANGTSLLTRIESAPTSTGTCGDIAMVNLPPLRSVIDVPLIGTAHVAEFLTLQQRKGSIMSAGSGRYSSPGPSDSRSSVSPQGLPREWM